MILLQLQSFLFEFDAAPQDHGGSYSCRYTQDRIAQVRQESLAMSCRCGHCGASPWPALPPVSASASADGSPDWQRSPDVLGQLRKVQRDIALAEAQVAQGKPR